MFQTISSLYSNLGWMGKTYVVTHAPTCVAWTLGAAEGVVRTAFHAIATVYSYATKNSGACEKHAKFTKQAFNITRGTGTLAIVSAIPIIGGGYGSKELLKQCIHYADYSRAYTKGEQHMRKKRLEPILMNFQNASILTSKDITQAFAEIQAPVRDVTLLDRDQNLEGSLIQYSFVYKIIYTTGDYLITGVAKGIRLTYYVAVNLFKNGLFKTLAKAATVAIQDEYKQTLNLVAVDKVYHQVIQPKRPRHATHTD